MELTEEMVEQLKSDLSKAKTYDDLMGKNGAIKNHFNDSRDTSRSRTYRTYWI